MSAIWKLWAVRLLVWTRIAVMVVRRSPVASSRWPARKWMALVNRWAVASYDSETLGDGSVTARDAEQRCDGQAEIICDPAINKIRQLLNRRCDITQG